MTNLHKYAWFKHGTFYDINHPSSLFIITRNIFQDNNSRYVQYRRFITNLIYKIEDINCRIYVFKNFLENGEKIKCFIDKKNDFIKINNEITNFIKQLKKNYYNLNLLLCNLNNYESSIIDKVKSFI